jgi:murein L,D-transpeptidase YcbB/YkuD
MQQHRFQARNTERIQNMIQEAQQKGLPPEPMQNKVHEGLAKKAPEEAIVRAVERVRDRYEYAYRHARELFNEPQQVRSIGNRLAEAHAAGLSNRDIARVMEQLQQRTREMNREQTHALAEATLRGARNMARLGVTSEAVANVYARALQHAYQARDMETLQHSFTRQARQGNPENVARGFSHGISQGLGAGGLGGGGSASGSGSGGSGSGGGGGGGSGGGGGGH